MSKSYSTAIFDALCDANGIPRPVYEFRFEPTRRWRTDIAWPDHGLLLECQGGIFVNGRHSRGAAMLKEWEKLNRAAALGYRTIFCQPRDLMKRETLDTIKDCLKP